METKIRILLADANPDFAKLLADTLAAEHDMELIGAAADGPETLSQLQSLRRTCCCWTWCCPSWTGWRCCAACPRPAASAR